MLRYLKCSGQSAGIVHYEMNPVFTQFLKLFTRIRTRTKHADNNGITSEYDSRFRNLWILVHLIDDIVQLAKVLFSSAINKIVILDRYSPIDGTAMKWYKGIDPCSTLKFATMLFPVPDSVIIIDVEPETALKRRPEHSLQKLASYRDYILVISKTYCRTVNAVPVRLIDGNQSLSAVVHCAIDILRNLLGTDHES